MMITTILLALVALSAIAAYVKAEREIVHLRGDVAQFAQKAHHAENSVDTARENMTFWRQQASDRMLDVLALQRETKRLNERIYALTAPATRTQSDADGNVTAVLDPPSVGEADRRAAQARHVAEPMTRAQSSDREPVTASMPRGVKNE